MPFDTFTPPLDPSVQSQRSVKSRINTAQFGDGYGQRSEDGLNASPRSFSAQWQALQSDEADVIETFFEGHVSSPFLWTVPLDSVQRKWIVADWSRGYVGAEIVTLSAMLTEVFDL